MDYSLEKVNSFSLSKLTEKLFFKNCNLVVVEAFVCPSNLRGYVDKGLSSPGRLSHGKLVLGEGPEKESFKNPYD